MDEIDYIFDFLQFLSADLSIKILTHLDDPSDLARVCLVSSSWRQFVIENGLSKQLFLRLFPDFSGAPSFFEVNNMINALTVRSNDLMEWEYIQKIHDSYLMLAKSLNPVVREDCISMAICVSTTDDYPRESVDNTLAPGDIVNNIASYWSSKGSVDRDVPERLTYELVSYLCVISEIRIQPFQAFFQDGEPIYSSKTVRFKMGLPKYSANLDTEVLKDRDVEPISESDLFNWTYVSPEFPMAQENTLQIFKLPEPVLCVGGMLQVELLGRVQRQEVDGLFYFCISHVQAVGRPLLPGFDVDTHPSGKFVLKYCPKVKQLRNGSSTSSSNGQTSHSRVRTLASQLLQRGAERWEQMVLDALLGGVVDHENDEADEEADEVFAASPF